MQKQECLFSIISFTETGSRLARQIKSILEQKFITESEEYKEQKIVYKGHQKTEYRQKIDRKIVVKVQESQTLTQPLREWCEDAFVQSEILIFVGAVGIAVRLVAPYVKDKFADPAVLVVDEMANFVVPILSGHVGGANQYANWIAKALGAVPVITTATDLYGKFAVDVFAAKNGLTISDRIIAKKISAAVLRGERIGFFCEADVLGKLPDILSGAIDDIIYKIYVGVFLKEQDRQTLFLHPKALVLGIGCKKGKSLAEIEDFVKRKFQEQELAWDSICAVASVEHKKQEQGLLQFCHKWQLPFYTFLSEELAEVPGKFTESKFVEHTVGVGNVCERAAVRCAIELAAEKKVYFPKLLLHKTAENGITLAITEIDWSVKFE